MSARVPVLILIAAAVAACGDRSPSARPADDGLPAAEAGDSGGTSTSTSTSTNVIPPRPSTSVREEVDGEAVVSDPGGLLEDIAPDGTDVPADGAPGSNDSSPPLDLANRADPSSPVGAACWALWEGAFSPIFRLTFGGLDPTGPPDDWFGVEALEIDPVEWAAYVAEMQTALADVPTPIVGVERALEALAPFRESDPFTARLSREFDEIRLELIAIGDELDADTWSEMTAVRFDDAQMAEWPGYDDFERRLEADPQSCGAGA